MVGAVLAGATEEEVAVIEQIASDVGLAFQIRDDILDETSTLETLGKPIHSDERNEKTTYVTLKGLEQATKDVLFLVSLHGVSTWNCRIPSKVWCALPLYRGIILSIMKMSMPWSEPIPEKLTN